MRIPIKGDLIQHSTMTIAHGHVQLCFAVHACSELEICSREYERLRPVQLCFAVLTIRSWKSTLESTKDFGQHQRLLINVVDYNGKIATKLTLGTLKYPYGETHTTRLEH